MGDGKRRLPVLSSKGPVPLDPSRPPWQWVGIGVAAMFLAWLPLAYLAQLVVRALVSARLGAQDPVAAQQAYAELGSGERAELQLVIMGLPAVALVIAALVGGMVIGRLDAAAGLRHATVAGALVAGSAALLALPSSIQGGVVLPWLLASAVVAVVAAAVARLGAMGGRSRGGAT